MRINSRVRRIVIGLVSACCVSTASLASAQTDEEELKAAFVINAINFVTWPDQAFNADDAPVTVCIRGHDPFGGQLKKMSKNQRVGGRDIRVLSVDDRAARVCHLIFVASIDPTDVDDVLQQQGKPILTVAESDGFAERGGIIQIRFERNPVRGSRRWDIGLRFRVNVKAATTAGLKISSRLLKVAEIIGDVAPVR